MRVSSLLLAMAILAIALFVRVAARSADAPGWLSYSAGIYSDEGIYSEDARLWVLYGQHMQGNFQASVVAPLQNALLLRVFRRYGISLIKLRMVSIVFAMATLAAFGLSLLLWYDTKTALIGLTLLSLSAPFVLYNRLGLLETPALLWIVLGYLMLGIAEYAASRADEKRAWPLAACRLATLLLGGLLIGVAVIWKPTFVLAAVALIAYALWRHRWLGASILLGYVCVLAVYKIVWYAPHAEELARVGRYYLSKQYLPHTLGGVWFNLRRGLFTGENDGVLPYLVKFAPILTLFTLLAAWPKVRARQDVAAWLWLAVPLAAMLLFSYTPSRYFLIFWPALAILAARTISSFPPRLAAIGLVIAIAPDTILLGHSWLHRTFTLHDDARVLAKVLPPGAWVAGQFAPSLCLDNSLRSLYVQKGLANTPAVDALKNLPITHVLATVTDSPKADPWTGAYGEMIQGPEGLETLPVGKKFRVRVYANEEALP